MLGKLLRYLILHAIVPALFLGIGWYSGAKYGAPDLLIRAVDGVLARASVILGPIISEGARQGGETLSDAGEAASDYVVGTVEETLRSLAETDTDAASDETDEADADETDTDEIEVAMATGPAEPAEEQPEEQQAEPATPPAAAPAGASSRVPDSAMNGEIVLCQMRISNAPRGGDPAEAIGKSDETGALNGVDLMLKPATKSCLSSGYGYRGGKLHKGIDYYSDMGGDALAAGDGVIAEAVTRSDYGNMLVIDHGNGVYTRYAHLARFGPGISEGASVSMGQTLGPIGMTGASSIVHLHYEVLTGDINTNAGSFGLEPVDPFGL